MADKYYAVGQGKIWIADRDSSGRTSGFTWIGDTDGFTLAGTQENLEFRESYSGNRAKVLDLVTSTDFSVSMQVRNIDAANLKRAFYGTSAAGTGATVTNEAHVAYASSSIFLKHPGVSAVSITKGVTPLVAGTDYTVDATFGRIDFVAGSSIITGSGSHAIEVDYTYATYEGKVQALKGGAKNYMVRFEGKSQFDNKPMIANLWNVRLSVPDSLELIGTDVGVLTLSGGLQAAPEILTTDAESQFFEIIRS